MVNAKYRIDIICPNCKHHTVQVKKKITKYNKPVWVCRECSIIVLEEKNGK
jgi:transposase-like protein